MTTFIILSRFSPEAFEDPKDFSPPPGPRPSP